MNTELLHQTDLERAAGILRAGGLVAVPTETVYGLAADATNEEAVEAVYAAKGRPEAKPLSILVTGMDMAERFCRDIPGLAYRLADAFWPGPLTMVMHDGGTVPDVVTANGTTLGVRCPDHPVTLALITALGRPLAAPSANRSGEPSPKSAQEVMRAMGGRIDAVLDGGACSVGMESTIVDLTVTPPRILRRGGLSTEQLDTVIGKKPMKIIGITGPTGAGKTTALHALRELGVYVIDADAVYHELLEHSVALRETIMSRFGDVFDGSGALDRKKLGAIVFGSPQALSELNAITHKAVGAEIKRRLIQAEREGKTAAAIDAIALLESGLGDTCDAVVGVIAPEALRIRRIMAREGITERYARMRVDAQKGEDYFRRHCTHILESTWEDTQETFIRRARVLFADILSQSQEDK